MMHKNDVQQLHAVPIMQDNYVWILQNSDTAVIVDPGLAEPVMTFLATQAITPVAILLTHAHDDHIGGVLALKQHYPNLKIYGPLEVANQLNTLDITLAAGLIKVGSLSFTVLSVPGHTLGHVAYYCQPYLFCGDTLFSAGCGRIVPNCAQIMYQSLQTLAALPNETLICCTHEYTVSNLQFAHHILPDNQAIFDALIDAKNKRNAGIITLPSTLKFEKEINPFLNCDSEPIKELFGKDLNSWQRFAALRKKKDEY